MLGNYLSFYSLIIYLFIFFSRRLFDLFPLSSGPDLLLSGFNSRTGRYIWVELACSWFLSLLRSRVFFSGLSGFFSLHKNQYSKLLFGLQARHVHFLTSSRKAPPCYVGKHITFAFFPSDAGGFNWSRHSPVWQSRIRTRTQIQTSCKLIQPRVHAKVISVILGVNDYGALFTVRCTWKTGNAECQV